jgi:dimeric dUTPase (all-alpha-NTP-PPase superfamily)
MENKNELNHENFCKSLRVEKQNILPLSDSFKKIFEIQCDLQEKIGIAPKARASNMQQKSLMLMEQIFCINTEFSELLDRLPWKHWKKYTQEQLKSWINEEQRKEMLFEYVDALHFFLNLAIILELQPEEIISAFLSKNKENFRRQDEGY